MKSPQFVVFTDSRGAWRWHLRARNGLLVAQGESYPTKAHALRGVAAVRRNAKAAGKTVVL